MVNQLTVRLFKVLAMAVTDNPSNGPDSGQTEQEPCSIGTALALGHHAAFLCCAAPDLSQFGLYADHFRHGLQYTLQTDQHQLLKNELPLSDLEPVLNDLARIIWQYDQRFSNDNYDESEHSNGNNLLSKNNVINLDELRCIDGCLWRTNYIYQRIRRFFGINHGPSRNSVREWYKLGDLFGRIEGNLDSDEQLFASKVPLFEQLRRSLTVLASDPLISENFYLKGVAEHNKRILSVKSGRRLLARFIKGDHDYNDSFFDGFGDYQPITRILAAGFDRLLRAIPPASISKQTESHEQNFCDPEQMILTVNGVEYNTLLKSHVFKLIFTAWRDGGYQNEISVPISGSNKLSNCGDYDKIRRVLQYEFRTKPSKQKKQSANRTNGQSYPFTMTYVDFNKDENKPDCHRMIIRLET